MATQNNRINYAQCSADQLMTFVRQRGLKCELQDHLVELLKDADRDATFRLLDLPPQIRNMIYEKALAIEQSGGRIRRVKAKLAILRTCKQVNQEVVALAGKRLSLPVCIIVSSGTPAIHSFINGKQFKMGDSTMDLAFQRIAQQTSLSVEAHMDIPVPATAENQIAAGKRLDAALNQFHSFVLRCNKINIAYIKLRHLPQLNERQLLDILSPLPALALTKQMQTIEFEFIDTPESLLQTIRNTITAFSTLRSMQRELTKVMDTRRRLHAFGIWSFGASLIEKNYRTFLCTIENNGIHQFANEFELEVAIDDLDTLFKNTWKRDIDGELRAEWEEQNAED